MKRVAVLALCLLLSVALFARAPLKDGDIVFHTSRSSQSVAIQRATASPYSHMGIVCYLQGKPFVLEAIDPVCYTPLAVWVARGSKGEYLVMRLRRHDEILTPEKIAKMKVLAKPLVGRRYDYFFEWSDDRLYCSELVYKIYEQALAVKLCPLRHLRDFNLNDPIVAKKLKERFGSKVPLGEPVVAPSDIAASPLLVTVPQ